MTMSHEQRIGLRAQFAAQARKDYAELKGKILLVTYLCGYTDSDPHDIKLSTPARMRVADTSDRMIVRTCGNWIDPIYEMDLLAPHEELEGYDSFDCYGTSYNVVTGATERAHFQIVADENPQTPPGAVPSEALPSEHVTRIRDIQPTLGGSAPIVITDFNLTEVSMHTGSGGQAILMHPPIDTVNVVQLGGETSPPGSREELESAVAAMYQARAEAFRTTAVSWASEISEAVRDLTDAQIDMYLQGQSDVAAPPLLRDFFERVVNANEAP